MAEIFRGSIRWSLLGLVSILLVVAASRAVSPAQDPLPIYVVVSGRSGAVGSETGEIQAGLGFRPQAGHVHLLAEADAHIVSDFDGVKQRLDAIDKASAKHAVIVRLQPPIGETKKRLRKFVDDTYSGRERCRALRRIVPILAPEPFSAGEGQSVPPGHGQDVPSEASATYAQFCDDVVYARYNFGGIALILPDLTPSVLRTYVDALASCGPQDYPGSC